MFVRTLATLFAALGVATTLSCQALTEWKGDVQVDPIERRATRLCGGNGKPTALGARVLQRQPYLQNTTSKSVTIRFAASNADELRIQVARPSLDDDDQVPATSVKPSFVGTAAQRRRAERRLEEDYHSISPKNFWLAGARIDGLEPGTIYCYQLVDGDEPVTEPAPLKTAPRPEQDQQVEMVVLGDSGTGSAAQRALAKRMSEHPFELMMFVGDIAYPSGSATQLQSKHFAVYADILRIVPSYTALGNHGYRSSKGAPILRAFELPDPERYYDLKWGPVHLFVLDSNRPTRRQYEWLESELAASELPYKIVLAHHPPYSSSLRGANPRFRLRFQRLWERYGVQAVIAGHEHHYERLGPIDGIHYIVTGGGGGRLTRVWEGSHTQVHRSVHHFLHIRANDEELTIRAIDIDGDEFDEITISPAAD